MTTNNLTVTGETKLGDNFYVTQEGDTHYDGAITENTHIVNKGYFDKNKAHFYSVNSGDEQRGNYNNDGATGTDAMAAGIDASAEGNLATAMGTGAKASEEHATAVGAQATAYDTDSSAFGFGAQAIAASSTALGGSSVANQYGATALGNGAQATGAESIALGLDAKASEEHATAVGAQATAYDADSSAFGYGAQAIGASSTALGGSSVANQYGATALGNGAQATGAESIALGLDAKASEEHATAVGAQATAYDADSSAFGYGAQAIGASSTALGGSSIAKLYGATALGNGAVAQGEKSAALGLDAQANKDQATAVGAEAVADGNRALALGAESEALADESIALGATASATAGSAMALGFGAQANHYQSVALGMGSITDAVVATEGIKLNGKDYEFAGKTPIATVSVGSKGAERTITHVAAGRISADSTDAINGSQLHATNSALTDLNSTVEGGLSFVGNDGEVIKKQLGETLVITGGLDKDADASAANIKTVQNADGALEIQLSKHLEDLETVTVDNSITVGGNTTINQGGTTTNNLTVTGETKLGNNFYVTQAGDTHYNGAITDNTHIVNKEYVDGQNAGLVEQGLSFVGNNGQVIHKELGQTLAIKGGLEDTKKSSAQNIRTVENNGELEIQLAEELEVTSVKAGTTILDSDGIRVGSLINLNDQGLFVTGGPSITVGGINMGDKQITNLAAGTENDHAVNLGQLKDVEQSVSDLGDRAVKYDGNTGDPKNTITLEGDKGTVITNLADGKIESGSKDAVNGGQIHDMGQSIADGMGGNSKFENGQLVTELNVGDKTYNNVNDALSGVHGDLSNKIENVENVANAGWNVTDAKGNTSNIGPNGEVAFTGDKNISVAQTGSKNKGQVEISLNQDLNLNSITAVNVNATNVTANEVTINNGPVINQNGIDMRDKQITNVADGVAPKDAVNVSQLENVKNDLHTEIGGVRRDLHKVDRKLRAGIAAAMATAALPQAYLPGKSMVGIGGGTWNGESGVALGVSTITDNGKWVFKFSGNASTRGDYGGTVGAGYQW
ncbi:YadA-like family protein [Thiopseudomonas alkaliphila]|uniref:YadA-like family protein n=1 Tax=Thiopseudomonas alkaliphila TaxID=1697053 RepID=UPI00069F4812|nr:YadA-like family protein [Thiopseudomonas alkaliphila]AKX53385.1 hypothetical protein AKN91_06660 [Thiopseudomonas alkaliphila]